MPYALTTQITFLRRRALAVLVVALALAATLAAASTSAQTLVRAHIARDGSVMVSGFDGGAPLAPATKP